MDGISRRSFLVGAGAAGMAAAVGAAGLVGCASGQDASGGGAAAQGAHPYVVHETDVVVIGSGLAGLHAAWHALKKGKAVTLLDKGRYAHSGNSGMNWGNMFGTNEYAVLSEAGYGAQVYGRAFSGDGLVDQQLALSIEQAWQEVRPACTSEQLGCILERLRDGSPGGQNFTDPDTATGKGSEAGMQPRVFAQKVKRMGADVRDRMFAASLLFSGDKERAAGVAAIDLRTGASHVFRAKAVVVATGSALWMSGWNGMRPHTHGSADLTGDGSAMLLNAGLPMADCEIFEQDQTQYEPLSTRNTVYTMGIQVTGYNWVYNAKGEKFAAGYNENPSAISQGSFMRLTQREIHEGRGTEHGGVLADTTNMDQVERFWRRTKEDFYRNLGYEVPDQVEVTPHFWAHGMRPFQLSENSETAIPGLFYAGEAPYVFTGGSTNACIGTGWMSGRGAAAVADGTDLPEVNWEGVDAAFAAAYAPIEREGEGTRPFDLMRMVQDVFWEGLGLIRDEQGIQNAITELQRIKDEELPKMVVPDKSRCMNNEWRLAMEVPAMLDCALATGHASTARKMSRGGTFCRSDYPELGDELFNTKTTFDGSSWTVETVPINAAVVDEQTLLASMPRVSFAHGFES